MKESILLYINIAKSKVLSLKEKKTLIIHLIKESIKNRQLTDEEIEERFSNNK